MSNRILIIFSVLSMMNIAHSTETTKSMCSINICKNYQNTVNYHCGRTGRPWGYYKPTSLFCADESCTELACYCPCQADPLYEKGEDYQKNSQLDGYNYFNNPQLVIDSNNEVTARACGLVIPGRAGNEFWSAEPPRCELAIAKKILDKEQVQKYVHDYVILQIGILDTSYKNLFKELQKEVSGINTQFKIDDLKAKIKNEVRGEIIEELLNKIKSESSLSDSLKKALEKK